MAMVLFVVLSLLGFTFGAVRLAGPCSAGIYFFGTESTQKQGLLSDIKELVVVFEGLWVVAQSAALHKLSH